MIKNRLVFTLLLLQSFHLYAQENKYLNVPKLTQNAFVELSFLSVKMPSDEKNLSLTGMNFNLYLN
jgi:hypothetical protein